MAVPKLTAGRHSWIIVVLGSLAMALAYMDRAILPLFVEEIKADLGINDFQFSLLTGLAFTLIYSLSSIPTGMLLDRRSRPRLLGIGVLVWSVATSLCGLGRTFTHLFLARVAVGVGESVVAPGTTSMVADMFMGKKLARAMASVSIGFVMGTGLAMIVGGGLAAWLGHDSITHVPFLGDLRAWQMVFLLLGIPGVLLAPVLIFFVADPPRRRVTIDADGKRGKSNYFELLKFFGRHRIAVFLNLSGYILAALANSGLSSWMPAHMMRVFNVSVAETGVALGLSQMIASIVAVVYGAFWIDRRLEAGHTDAAMQLSRNAVVLAMIPLVAFYFMPSFMLSVIMAIAAHTLISLAYSVASVSHTMLAPNQIRAQFSATFLFLSSFLGMALGPSLVALFNGWVYADPAKIGLSATVIGVVALVGSAILLTLGQRPYRKTIEEVVATTGDDVSLRGH